MLESTREPERSFWSQMLLVLVIAAVTWTTDFCKTLSWMEVYTSSLVALDTGPENNGNNYQHLCLWHDPSILVERSGPLCLEVKKEIRELDATNMCSPFKNTYPVGLPRPPQLSLPTTCMEVANYLEVSGESRKCDKPRCVQNSLCI